MLWVKTERLEILVVYQARVEAKYLHVFMRVVLSEKLKEQGSG